VKLPVTRTRWPPDFPDVIIHATVARRDADPTYAAAKAGDADAALKLAENLVNPAALAELQCLLGNRRPLLLPVVAEEAGGFNAIPDAVAQLLGRMMKLAVVAGDIVQTNKVGHTRAKAFQRLVTPAEFGGSIQQAADYILIDDHVGLGGTLANLRGYVEGHDGRVIAMTTLTESREGRYIALRPATLDMLRSKHGEALDHLWESQFGYQVDCLTEVEAQVLCRQPSVAGIEDFLAQAAIEARGRGLEPTLGTK
jgi:hypothetical protein